MTEEFLPPDPDAVLKAKELYEQAKQHEEAEIARVQYQLDSGWGDALWLIAEVQEETAIACELLTLAGARIKAPDNLYHAGIDQVIRKDEATLLPEFPKLVALPIHSGVWLHDLIAGLTDRFTITLSAQIDQGKNAAAKNYSIQTPTPFKRACAVANNARQALGDKIVNTNTEMWMIFEAASTEVPESLAGVKHAAIVMANTFINGHVISYLIVDKWEYEYDESGNYSHRLCKCDPACQNNGNIETD